MNNFQSPAHLATESSRNVLENLLLTIKNLPGRVDRSMVLTRIEKAILSLRQVTQSSIHDPKHLEWLEDARDEVKKAHEAVNGTDYSEQGQRMSQRIHGVIRTLEQVREATIDAIVAKQDKFDDYELAQRAQQAVPTAQAFAISQGSPQLHAIERDLLKTYIDIEPDDFVFDRATDNQDASGQTQELADMLEAEDEASSIDPAKRLPLLSDVIVPASPLMEPGLPGELAQLRRLIRTALEDIGAMSLLRRCEANERYEREGTMRFERRMCECLDTIVALGEPFYTTMAAGGRYPGINILEETLTYGRDAVTVDPARTFARMFVMTSIAGEDTIRAAILALKQSPPLTYAAQAEALALSPNPQVNRALERLCGDDDADLVILAIEAWGARGHVKLEAITPLLAHPAEEVRLAAIEAMRRAHQPAAAAKTLKEICNHESDHDFIVTAIESLLHLNMKDGLLLLRQQMDAIDATEAEQEPMRTDLQARCMQALSIHGEANDLNRLSRFYYGDAGQAMAIGFHGHPAVVAELITIL